MPGHGQPGQQSSLTLHFWAMPVRQPVVMHVDRVKAQTQCMGIVCDIPAWLHCGITTIPSICERNLCAVCKQAAMRWSIGSSRWLHWCRKALVDSGLSVRSLGLGSARGTRDEAAHSDASRSVSGSMSARASPSPAMTARATPTSSASTSSAPSPLGVTLSPYKAPLPAASRQSIMMVRRGSMARKSVLGAQIGKGV